MLRVAEYKIACNIYWYWCLVALLEHEDGTWIAPMQEMKNLLCSTAIEGGPFSYKLPPELAISHNMAGICIITQQ